MEPIEIETENEPVIPRKKINPPVDFSSRAIRFRLFVLVGSLLMVFVMMREAGRPEFWRWLGVLESTDTVVENSESTGDKNMLPAVPEAGGSTVRVVVEKNNPASQPAKTLDNSESQNQEDSKAIDPQVKSEAAKESSDQQSLRLAHDFWQDVFTELPTREKIMLVGLLRDMNLGVQYAPDVAKQMHEVIERIDVLVKTKSVKDLESLQVTNQADASQIIALSREWDEILRPFLDGGIDKEIASLEVDKGAFGIWQSHFDSAILKVVEDQTEILRTAEGPAWLSTWVHVLDETSTAHRRVTYFDLTSQPAAFRGQPVEISGTLVGIQPVNMVKNSLGIDQYYILWIRDFQFGRPLMCVYSLELPKNVTIPKTMFSHTDFDVKIKCRFFKIRNYVSSDDTLETCPLLLGKQAVIVPRNVKTGSNINWLPPVWFFPLIGVIVLFLAGLVIRTMLFGPKQRVYAFSKDKLSRLSVELESLKDNPSIRSDRERLADMEREG